jgi:hypothetical protein
VAFHLAPKCSNATGSLLERCFDLEYALSKEAVGKSSGIAKLLTASGGMLILC